jgi:hypothetical protein
MTPSAIMFNKTAKTWRKTVGAINEYSEKSYTWTARITVFKCALQPVSGKDAQTIEGQAILASHRLYCAYGTDILCEDRVECDSKLYLVKWVDNESNRNSHLKALLEQVTAN